MDDFMAVQKAALRSGYRLECGDNGYRLIKWQRHIEYHPMTETPGSLTRCLLALFESQSAELEREKVMRQVFQDTLECFKPHQAEPIEEDDRLMLW